MTLSFLMPLSLIIIAGMPHGAADGALAINKYRENIKRLLFFSGYIITAGLAYFAWHLMPSVALSIFLVVTVLHFGGGDVRAYRYRQQSILPVIAHGSTLLVFMSLGQTTEIKQLMAFLVGETNAGIVVAGMQWFAVLWLASAIYSLYLTEQIKRLLAEFAFIAMIALLLPPLWSFCIYFCAIHSVRHFRFILPTVKASPLSLGLTILFSILGVALAVLLFFIYDDVAFDEAILRATVVTLFMLTIPHMLFIDCLKPLKSLRK